MITLGRRSVKMAAQADQIDESAPEGSPTAAVPAQGFVRRTSALAPITKSESQLSIVIVLCLPPCRRAVHGPLDAHTSMWDTKVRLIN